MRNRSSKLKIIFPLLFLMVFFGCSRGAEVRQPTNKGEKQEEKNAADPQSAVVREKRPVKMLFVGDMMFDRYIREAAKKYGNDNYGYIIEPLKDQLSKYDLVVGNLEGPITKKESVSVNSEMDEKRNLVFTFDPAVAKTLFENNIKLVSLGNNHILNQGGKGIDETKKNLEEARVDYFGDTESSGNKTFAKNINNIKISFVNYNYSVSGSEERAIDEIKSGKKNSDLVIACPHWGTEYKMGEPGETARALAHRFIDAGADAVIGTHPHVVQNLEDYNGKKIFYSLGNFVFDQYFQKETMEGLGVELSIRADKSLEYGELKFEMTKRGQTKIK